MNLRNGRTAQKTTRNVVAALFGLGIAVAAPAFVLAQGENLSEKVSPSSSQNQLSNGALTSFADLVETVSPAVVSVRVRRKIEAPEMDAFPNLEGLPEQFRRFFPRSGPNGGSRQAEAQGSGFIIDSDGYVVTNNHVIDGGDEILIVMNTGKEYSARLIGTDPQTDLALLKIDSKDKLPYVPFGDDEKLRVGDWVVAVGNPFGLGGTVTAGIISARGRAINSSIYNDFLQIDAPINRGNSGGPTFDLDGKVVGVNSFIFSPSGGNVGIGFAIPSTTAEFIIGELKANGEITRGFLGINIQGLTEEIADAQGLDTSEGAIITDVSDASPAKKAGFKIGDVVLEVDGEKVKDSRDLTRKVGQLKPGQKVSFRIWRGGKEKSIKAKIAKRETGPVASNDNQDNDKSDSPLGLAMTNLDDEWRNRINADESIEGVVVTQVLPGSPADHVSIRPGDVILQVNNEDVSDADEVLSRVKKAKKDKRKSVLLLVWSRGVRRFVPVNFEETE